MHLDLLAALLAYLLYLLTCILVVIWIGGVYLSFLKNILIGIITYICIVVILNNIHNMYLMF